MTLLQKAREGRKAALECLASYNIDNIFADEPQRQRTRRPLTAMTFSTARGGDSDVANLPLAPELRHAA